MPLARVSTTFRLPLAPERARERVELLAPAGSFESLKAAVENGADAVYLAGQHFGARKFAKNFTDEELRAGIDYAHVRGVKVFVVVNTLVFNEEFDDVVAFLALVREAGADSVIVQDLGVMKVLRDLFPDLPLHISTQATVHNAKGVEFLEGLGAERAILAREMTLKDIVGMKKKTGAELETFVHGALCYCYSGQCLMSSLIGERSGNRGACAYTCRLPYDMKAGDETLPDVREKHVLSSKDLNQIESIPKLIEAGVTSFKIEGRMKRPEYVAVVTRAYRNAIDRYYAGDFHITDAEHHAIAAVFNREFTPGYLEGKEKWAFTSWDTDGNRGTPLGEIVESGRGYLRVKLAQELRVKDGISVLHMPTSAAQGNDEPEEYGFTVNRIEIAGRWVTDARPGAIVTLTGQAKASVGDKVYKTADHDVLVNARETFEGPPQRRVGVTMRATLRIGSPIRVELTDPERGIVAHHESAFLVQPAKTAPLREATVREQLAKLAQTVLEADAITIELDEAAFVPLGELNDARRGAVAALERAIASRAHRVPLASPRLRALPVVERPRKRPTLAVNCWGVENVEAALAAGAKEIYYTGLKVGGLQPKWDEDAVARVADVAKRHDAKVWLASGMIQKDWEIEALRHAVRATGLPVLAGNHGACRVAIEERVPFIVDWPMNVYNSITVDFLVEQGAERITLSPELTMRQMADVARHTKAPLEALAHGRLTLMTSEYCTIGHATRCQMPGGTWAPCHDKAYSLEDRLGKTFPLATDGACRMYILNSVELAMADRLAELADAGLDVLRIESIGTSPPALALQVRTYLSALARTDLQLAKGEWKALEAACPDGFTTGHYYRGPA